MARGPWLMAGLWSAGTAAATTLAWVGAHAVSSAIGATPVPVVPPAPAATSARGRTGLADRTPATAAAASTTTTVVRAVSPRTATFSDPGGTITVRCSAGRIELLSASPSDGYRGDVDASGPTLVSVTFLSRNWSYQIDARCPGGAPAARSTLNRSPTPPPPR